MVRLLVPEGDDQHALTQKRPPELGTEPLLVHSPWRSCTLAAVSTAFLSLAGRAHPGTFVKSVAWFSIADLSMTACELYTRRELNRAMFKTYGLQPTPAKLWESTSWWTLEDSTLCFGTYGLFLALNRRIFPTVTSWKRYLGLATVGCAVGAQAQQVIPRLRGVIPSYEVNFTERRFADQKKKLYRRLEQDDVTKATLSRPARSLLTYYTSDSAFLWLTGFFSSQTQEDKSTSSTRDQRPFVHSPAIDEMREPVSITVDFDKDELAAPDYCDQYRRMYQDDPAANDQDALQEHLEHLVKLKTTNVAELAYLWDELARKELVMYKTPEFTTTKDLLRRELRLLNIWTREVSMRVAVIDYSEAETRKRLGQIQQQEEPASSIPKPLTQAMQHELAEDWKKTYSPDISTKWIRRQLENMKQALAEAERLSGSEKPQAHQSSLVHAYHAKLFRDTAKNLKMNVDATEKLLREFEDQVYRAEFYKDQ